ncbi:hypothetical protein AACH06_29775 [Ideonella sp. DXS29W]|uniref:Uncharacterized protein n=1 Tax=Ideonella lacteola TaxID=2984193 RepID=A0ABU9BYT4_9BURK
MSPDTPEKIAFLFLGWLLGMLSPIVVDAIKRRRENTLGRSAILAELAELADILATAAYGAKMHAGTVDRSFLEWLKTYSEQHATIQSLQEFIPRLRTQLSWSDADLQKIASHMSADDGKGSMLQHYPIPLLDARVSALWTFDTSFQRQLLAIRRNVALLDDIVDRSRKYFDLTFSKLEGENYRLVTENLVQTYSLYASRAVQVVDQIVQLKSIAS